LLAVTRWSASIASPTTTTSAQKRANIAALTRNPRFHLLESSLNDIDLAHTLKDAEVVFHLAAQAGVRKSWGSDFEHYIEHNIRATQRLCEAMKGTGIRLVYSSSSSVYGETEQLPMREDHPTRPRSPYGVTKLAGETLCLLYGANHGLPVACLRYFTVYGPAPASRHGVPPLHQGGHRG
jgi:UDP-glucose 4-epimerase